LALGETGAGQPIALVKANASFTGLGSGDVLLCAAISNTTLIGIGLPVVALPRIVRQLEKGS
jgi:hypothetical protein